MSRSRKFLYIIPDDQPLKKQPQIGCMTGILQLFDRHHVPGFHGNKTVTAASSWYELGSPKSVPSPEYGCNENGEMQPPRGSMDSRSGTRRMLAFEDVVTDSIQRDQGSDLPAIAAFEKYEKIEASLQHCLSPDLRKQRSHRRVSSSDSTEIPWRSSPRAADNGDSIKPPNVLVESRESTSSRFFPLKERPRYSCDGREISRQPFPVDNRNAYRSSSLRVMESPRYSVDTSTKRPPNVIARLMGLDEMPDSVPLTYKSSPRPSMGVETPKQFVSEAKTKAQDKSRRAEDKSASAEDLNHQGGLEVLENTFRTEANSMVETPRPQLQPEIPGPQLQPGQQPDPMHAIFVDYLNKPKVNLEDSDRDLQVLEKIVEAIKMKQSLRPISAPASPSKTADVDFGGKLENKSTCSSPGRNESIFSHRYGGGNSGGSLSKPRAAQKKCMVDDQKSCIIVRGKSPSRSLNLSTDDSPRRLRLLASKTLDEKSNSSPPVAHQPSNHYFLRGNETLPNQKLKSSKVAPKEQRKKSVMEIRVEKKNMNKNGSKNGHHGKFNLQNPKIKKSLEVRPESKRLTSKSSSNCKAQKVTTDKSSGQEDITEDAWEKKVEVLPEFVAEHPSQLPTKSTPALVLDYSLFKEDISPGLLSKRALNFEGNEIRAPDNLARKDTKNSVGSFVKDIRKSEEPVVLNLKANNKHQSLHMEPNSMDYTDKTFLRQMDSTSSVSCIESQKNSCKLPEFYYVAELFEASGLLKNREENHDIFIHFYSQPGFAIDLQIFYELEKKFKTLNGGHKNRMHRRLVFDTVNEILRKKSVVPSNARQRGKLAGYGDAQLSVDELLKQVLVGIQSLSGNQWEDIMDGLCQIVKKDVEMWGGERTETELGDMVLDLEKSIFRDLMDEVVFDLIF